ncbi:MAG: hypothetical protein QM757_28030 [Paludibaculum sp.]
MALYLVWRGYRVEESLIAFWAPFLAADLGNYAGGAVSSWLVHRGWAVGRARKAVVIPGALGVLLLIPRSDFRPSLMGIALLFGGATFSYAAFSTMANNVPGGLFLVDGAVASVSGLGGAAAGAGTQFLLTYAVGSIADKVGFRRRSIGASLIPLVAMVLVLALVRNTKASGQALYSPADLSGAVWVHNGRAMQKLTRKASGGVLAVFLVRSGQVVC